MAKRKRDLSPKQRHNQDIWRMKGAIATLLNLSRHPAMSVRVHGLKQEMEAHLQNLLDNTNHYDR